MLRVVCPPGTVVTTTGIWPLPPPARPIGVRVTAVNDHLDRIGVARELGAVEAARRMVAAGCSVDVLALLAAVEDRRRTARDDERTG